MIKKNRISDFFEAGINRQVRFDIDVEVYLPVKPVKVQYNTSYMGYPPIHDANCSYLTDPSAYQNSSKRKDTLALPLTLFNVRKARVKLPFPGSVKGTCTLVTPSIVPATDRPPNTRTP